MDIKTLRTIYKAALENAVDEVEFEDKKGKMRMRLSNALSASGETVVSPLNLEEQSELSPGPGLQSASTAMAEQSLGWAEDLGESQSLQREEKEKFNLKSPEIGFFSRFNPKTKKQYVKLRDKLKKGSVIGIVVSLQVVYEVKTDRDGKIVEFLVEEEQPVEYHQPIARFLPLKN